MDYKTAQGWLRDDEREHLVDLARQVPADGMIINIGVEYGASLVCFRAGNPLCSIIALDIDMTKLPVDVYFWTRALLVDGDSRLDETRVKVSQIVDAFDRREPEPHVDLLFIDGDHTFEGILCDTKYCNLILPGGKVVFHDCFDFDNPGSGKPNPNAPDVNRAVMEWKQSTQYWVDQGTTGTMRIFERV